MSKAKYMAAMYLRLSRDDISAGTGKAAESGSIGSQREIIREFLSRQEDMELFDTYVDDGFTGSNFERPEFMRMKEDIEAGKVNCVIVKDLSRFGREHIEAGRLILKTFPALHVRFIAITDHFDSLTADASEKNIVLPFRNFCNDSYCRDISTKVRSEQQMKRVNGEFIGAFAVYGYLKHPDNKNKLIVDEYAADVVRKIFSWKMMGMSAYAIAGKLDEAGILSPLSYKKFLGMKWSTGFSTGSRNCWSAVAVTRILTNEVYLGVLAQGKREKINYKIKKCVIKPEQEWVRVENAHAPIISKHDFAIVKKLLQVDGRATAGKAAGLNLFMGILFCADCHEQMVRRKNTYKGTEKIYYICSTKNRGEGCSRHSIEAELLEELVLKEIRQYLRLLLEQNDLFEQQKNTETDFESVLQYDKQIARLKEEQSKYDTLCAGLYEDLEQGILTKQEHDKYHADYSKYIADTQTAIDRQIGMVKSMFQNGLQSGMRLENLKKNGRIETLDRAALVNFISKIEVYENKKIEITFSFQDEIRIMLFANKAYARNAEKMPAPDKNICEKGGALHAQNIEKAE